MSVPSPYFSVLSHDAVRVVRFSRADVVDGAYIERLGGDLATYLAQIETPNVVIDLENVTHLSSAALGMLVKVGVSVSHRDGGLRLANVSDDLTKIFKMTKLHKVLRIHESVEEAVESMG